MPIRFRYVGKSHYICRGGHAQSWGSAPPPCLPRSAKRFWEKCGLCATDNAIIACCDGELVGFFRYSAHKGVLFAYGTWVAPKLRKQGLATRMWKRVLRRHMLVKLSVMAISTGGRALLRSLRGKGLVEEVPW